MKIRIDDCRGGSNSVVRYEYEVHSRTARVVTGLVDP